MPKKIVSAGRMCDKVRHGLRRIESLRVSCAEQHGMGRTLVGWVRFPTGSSQRAPLLEEQPGVRHCGLTDTDRRRAAASPASGPARRRTRPVFFVSVLPDV